MSEHSFQEFADDEFGSVRLSGRTTPGSPGLLAGSRLHTPLLANRAPSPLRSSSPHARADRENPREVQGTAQQASPAVKQQQPRHQQQQQQRRRLAEDLEALTPLLRARGLTAEVFLGHLRVVSLDRETVRAYCATMLGEGGLSGDVARRVQQLMQKKSTLRNAAAPGSQVMRW